MKKIDIILLLAILPFFISYSQWSTDPYNNLIVGYGLHPEIASDSAGGCYITYEGGTVYPRHITIQRLNRYGYKTWGSGKRILGEYPEQSSAKITEDGEGGVIVSYLDVDSDNWPYIKTRLRVQRIDSSGNFLWGPTGVRVSLSETNQGNQAIVSDGNGGCIVAWKDTLDIIRIQRINNAGIGVWGESGLLLSGTTQYNPRLVKTSSNSFIIAFGTLLKKYDLDGNAGWGGQAVNVGFGTRSIIPDKNGGIIVYDGTGTSSNILIVTQRIDSLGIFLWNSPYVVLDDSAVFNVLGNPVSLNADGGATFAWVKRVKNVNRAFTQRISSNGTFEFSEGPIQVSAYDSLGNGTWVIVNSELDSKIYVNADGRNNGSIYAQRIDSRGNRIWNPNDNVISLRELGYLKAVTDMQGGVIVVGFDQSDFSIRTQQCNKNGNIGVVLTSLNEFVHTRLPTKFTLHQNYPNPFNPITVIRYQLPIEGYVSLKVFNVLGQEVATLVDEVKVAGHHSIEWNSTNNAGNTVASGVYIYRLEARGVNDPTKSFTQVKRMILLR